MNGPLAGIRIVDTTEGAQGPYYESLFHDPAALEQAIVLDVEHPRRGAVRTVGLAWNLTGAPGSVRRAPPLLGEHTDEILAELDYTPERVSDLRARAIVA